MISVRSQRKCRCWLWRQSTTNALLPITCSSTDSKYHHAINGFGNLPLPASYQCCAKNWFSVSAVNFKSWEATELHHTTEAIRFLTPVKSYRLTNTRTACSSPSDVNVQTCHLNKLELPAEEKTPRKHSAMIGASVSIRGAKTFTRPVKRRFVWASCTRASA